MNGKTGTRWRWEIALFGSILICIGVLVASEVGHLRLQKSYEKAMRETAASAKLSNLLGMVTDAETSQRGYLLTERNSYLETYNEVVPKINPLVIALRDAYYDPADPSMLNDFSALAVTLREKLSELELTLALVQQGKKDIARELTLTDIGKEKMDLLRKKVIALQAREAENTARSVEQWRLNRNLSRLAVALVTAFNIVLLVILLRWLRRDWAEAQRRQEHLKEQQVQLDRLVAERTSQLEVLASHLQQVSENEKSRIARELHDELGAILTASKMDVSWVRQHLKEDQGALGEKLARALKNLDQGVQVKRRIIENLVPSTLTTFGLVVALRELTERMEASTGWALGLELPGDDLVLPSDASIALFRIAQESINNAAKYAQAKTLTLKLVCGEASVWLEIEDDGIGFNPRNMRPKSHGLAGMRQRMIGLGGSIQVDSHPGRGTRVHARLPLAAPDGWTATATEPANA